MSVYLTIRHYRRENHSSYWYVWAVDRPVMQRILFPDRSMP